MRRIDHRSDWVVRLRSAIVVLIALVMSQSAFAQAPAGTDALIEAAKKSGSTVIVITPESKAEAVAPTVQPTDPVQELVAGATSEVRRIVNGWGELAAAARSAIAAHGEDGSVAWVFPTALLGLALIGIGALVAWLLARWVRGYFAAALGLSPKTRVERLVRVFAAVIVRCVLLAVLLAVPLILGAFFWPGDVAWRVMMTSFLLAVALIGAISIAMGAVLAPNEPHLRVVALTDAEAKRLFRHVMIAATVGIVVLGFCRWMLHLGVPRETLKPGVVLATFVTAAGFSVVAVANRSSVGRLIAGQSGVAAPGRQKLARIWPALAILYFTLAFFVSAIRILLDRPNALGLVGFPILVLIAAFSLYGAMLVFMDLFVARREAVARANELKEVDAGLRTSISPASSDFSLLRKLLERSAAVIAFVVGFYLLAKLWGIDRAAGEALTAAVIQVAIVLLIAYIGYHAARLWVDRQIAGEAHRAASGAVPGGHTSSRLATLLPVFRNFLLITIGTITTLVVLSRVGVDIGPLLAGAGVVGLAVGFGAQTLVKDIISGAFFLMDDAFRIGEYIDIGSGKGTVEKISVRSMQLRHQDGPLSTVPFGSIDKVNNFSRDWAIMKIPLRVTYDTDADHVRKLVRKLGEELAGDPELGKQFLEPLKSQGIVAMEDSAMIIRVKFKTRPGDQSEIRKVVYARIRELFHREGIHFAQKEVRVRIADSSDVDSGSLSQQQRVAIQVAAQVAVDEDNANAAAAKE